MALEKGVLVRKPIPGNLCRFFGEKSLSVVFISDIIEPGAGGFCLRRAVCTVSLSSGPSKNDQTERQE